MKVSAALILAAVLAVPAFARAMPGKSAASTAVAAFAPVAAVVAAVATVIAAVTIRWLAILPAIPAVLLVGWQLPRRRRRVRSGPVEPAAQRSAGTEVRVLSLNALVGGASAESIRAEVLRLAPDVLTVQELTPELAGRLADVGLTDLLPYYDLEPLPGPHGIGTWSRWPLGPRSAVLAARRPMLRLKLDAGVPVTVTLVHAAAPVGARQHAWRRDLSVLLSSLSEVAGHHLLIGDFNATHDMKEFRQLLAAGFADCADAAADRQWPGFTWPADRWLPPLLRLDHVLVSQPGALVRESRTVRVPGTDHLAVFAAMELRPDARTGDTR